MHTPEDITGIPGYKQFYEACQDIFSNQIQPTSVVIKNLLQQTALGFAEFERTLLLGLSARDIQSVCVGVSGPNYLVDVLVKDSEPRLYEPWIRFQMDHKHPAKLHILGGPYEFAAEDDGGCSGRWFLPKSVKEICQDVYLKDLSKQMGDEIRLVTTRFEPIKDWYPLEQRLELRPTRLLGVALPLWKEIYLASNREVPCPVK